MSEESHLTTETLLAMILLIIFIVCGPLFEKLHFHYAHESGIVMIIGVVITLIVNFFDPEVSYFNIYFLLIRPVLLSL
jgi:hypothetical protein